MESMDLDSEDSMDFDSEDSMDSEPGDEWECKQLISLSPQFVIRLVNGNRLVRGTFQQQRNGQEKRNCNPGDWTVFRLATGAEITHFHCPVCNGQDHEEEHHHKAPLEVKHPLHPRHSLQLFLWTPEEFPNRKCYCCDEDLIRIFYYCCDCNFAMNIACVEKPPVLSIHHPKWHEHTLALFPSRTLLTCKLCALPHLHCPFYICPPCDFVAHQTCISLPRVIRISRHLRRISFTFSFDQGDWSCGVCRKKIYNDYGGYSCIRNGCSYAVHSKCATQRNIWDGVELEGTPEEDVDEERVEPFLRISNGIIQHFSHQHHLRLDENANRDYDENKLCQACITPIYFGNFYSCMQCDFILHEKCASLSLEIQHPTHPHMLTLVTVAGDGISIGNTCSACPWMCGTGFFYKCGTKGCYFKLNVQCATISEPLVHGSHMHPLFLTSTPRERRRCSVCKSSRNGFSETFNCIECNDFSLCFMCATIPQKVRYKHDKHMFTLSYGKETSTMTYWCEACERKINPKGQFYTCDESCSVMLHIRCLIGEDLYMKPGLLLIDSTGVNIDVLRNNHCVSRPICKVCKRRCQYKTVFQCSGFIFCSRFCLLDGFWRDVII